MRIGDMCLLELILYSSNWFVFLINCNPVFTYIHTQRTSLLFLNNLWMRKSFIGCGRAYVIGITWARRSTPRCGEILRRSFISS